MSVGVMVDHLGASQLAYYLIKAANQYVQDFNDEVIVFYEELVNPCLPLQFCSMNMKEAYGYNAPVIATSLATARKLLVFPGPPRKYFYINDLEWIRHKPREYSQFQEVYRANGLILIARSKTHAEIIADCWNVSVPEVFSDNDFLQLLGVASAPANTTIPI